MALGHDSKITNYDESDDSKLNTTHTHRVNTVPGNGTDVARTTRDGG